MSGRLSLISQNQPMLNPSNFGGPFELGDRGNLPPPAPLSAALAATVYHRPLRKMNQQYFMFVAALQVLSIRVYISCGTFLL